MTNDHGLISYDDFARQEFAMVQDIIQVRKEVNDEIRAEMEKQSAKITGKQKISL